MPSRETRRNKEKKTIVEKNREKHPVVYVISVVILVIVVVAFIFMGSNMSQARARYVFGSYEGKDIEWIENNFFDERREFWGEQYSQSSQSQDSNANLYQIFRRAFDETANMFVIVDQAQKSGYQINRSDIVDQIQNYPLYLDRTGQFDIDQFDETNAITRNIIEKNIERKVLMSNYLNDELFNRKISQSEIDAYKNLMAKERSFEFVSFKFDDFPSEEIVKYGKENSEKFRKVRLGRILFSQMSESDVETLRENIINSVKSFEETAREYSSDVYREQGGDMGFQYFYQVQSLVNDDEALAQKIFDLPLNTLSEVIPNGDNFEIYTSLGESVDPNFEDQTTIDDILEYMNRYQRDVIENAAEEKAAEFQKMAAETSLEAACRSLGMTGPFTTESFPINYLGLFDQKMISSSDEDAPSISTALDSQEFFEKAFALDENEVSTPILLSDQWVVVSLNNETQMTDEEWDSYNSNLLQALTFGQANDFAIYSLQQQLYQVTLNYSMSYQFLMQKLFTRADKEGIPISYLLYTFLAEYKDFDKYIQNLKTEKLNDQFDENFNRVFSQSAG